MNKREGLSSFLLVFGIIIMIVAFIAGIVVAATTKQVETHYYYGLSSTHSYDTEVDDPRAPIYMMAIWLSGMVVGLAFIWASSMLFEAEKQTQCAKDILEELHKIKTNSDKQ